MNHDVYISYSSKDSVTATQICEILEANDVKCWFCQRDLEDKDNHDLETENAIENSKAVVLVFSASSFESDFVRNDVNVAYSSDIPIISFKIDDFQDFQDNPLFFLSVLIWIDGHEDVKNSYVDLVIEVKTLLEHDDLDPEPILSSIYKSLQPVVGIKGIVDDRQDSPLDYVYLSHDDSDLFASQVAQFENIGVNFNHDDESLIDDASLLAVLISKDSRKSSKIKNEIIRAISKDIDIVLIHSDDSQIDFGRIFNLRYGSKFKKAIKFSIFKQKLNELEYMEKCDEIFNRYGVKNSKSSLDDLKNLIKTQDEITLTDDIIIKKGDSAKSIELNRDNIVIDGEGYSISAECARNLFSVSSKNVIIRNVFFKDCTIETSSLMSVGKDATLSLMDCMFESNEGNLISNMGEIEIINTLFHENGSESSPILSKGLLKIESCEFKSNKSADDGGAIINEGKLHISSSRFSGNECKGDGGAIYNKNILILENNQFMSNTALNEGSSIYNMSQAKCYRTSFSAHDVKSSIIFNDGMFEFADCRFAENMSRITIENKQKADLSIFNTLFIYNEVIKANLYNQGRCFAVEVTFEMNKIDCKNSFDIYNEDDMTLKRFKVDEKTIFNDGNILADRSINCGTSCMTTGIDKPLAEPEGIFKPQQPIVGQINDLKGRPEICPECGSEDLIFDDELAEVVCNRCGFIIDDDIAEGPPEWRGVFKPKGDIAGSVTLHSYVYLSFDESDLEFIESQIIQYENQNVNFVKDDPSKIINSSLVEVFVSKNSYKSLRIKEDIDEAHECDVAILVIYLDDVKSEFEELFDTTEDSGIFTIEKYKLSELDYISRCSEIFTLYGVKSKEEKHSLEITENYESPKKEGLTFTDLDYLIQDSSKITLTDDIHLVEGESSAYENGIELIQDNLIIEGNGFSISASDIGRIFTISSKNVTLKDLNFKNCSLKGTSAIVHVNEDASINLDNCNFESNLLDDGHAIYTFGDVNVKDSKFEKNHSENEGTAIFARKGNLNITGTEFIENESQNSGGAILNWAKLNIKDSSFIKNHAEGYGGAIGNVIDANMKVTTSEFIENDAVGEACAIYNENRASCVGCSFTKNNSKLSLIFNEISFDLVNCNFKNNKSRIIVQNNENGVLYLSNSKFIENEVLITNVYNNGESFSLEKVEFKDNKSAIIQAVNIYNETYMRLKEPKLDDNTIFNRAHMDIWKYDSKLINNNGTVSVMDGPCDQEFSFSWLDKRINESRDKIILLENNVKLENCELDFYEGGMEICRNNVIIDGNGHYIDGAKRTAILYVTGKNVTIKNIRFKNANLISDSYRHITGGSAIRTVTSSSLKVESCDFENNECDDDGGAILNRSELEVSNSRFKNNTSRSYGGAICNKERLYLDNNEFMDNSSRIRQDIFSSKTIQGNFDSRDVFDVGGDYQIAESFSHLRDKIYKSPTVSLNKDIKFNYKVDQDLKDGIEIDGVESLTIEGNGFSIDGDDRAALFNLKNSNVVFKNITFKNAVSQKHSIFENDANATFISCRFINNHASYDSSLVNNQGHIKLVDCQFINNLSKNRSLISNCEEFEMDYCEFSLNSNEKSTIENNSNLTISNSKFINNHSNENAGAIRNEKEAKLFVKDSYLISNSTQRSGGAVLNYGDLLFEGCVLESNSADGDGGVINNERDANLKMISCDIMNNFSRGDGGAIINWGNLSFEYSKFLKNRARKDGGVVNIQKGSLRISSCKLIKNKAFDGGSIFNRGKLSVENSEFEDNSAKKDGGALNTYEGDIKIRTSIFKNNIAGDGGVIYSREGEIIISESEFSDNVADINGGAIISWCEMTIENSRLLNNSAKIYGGAINNQKQPLTLKNCELIENRADTGGAIFNVVDDNIKTVDCEFKDNSPDDIY